MKLDLKARYMLARPERHTLAAGKISLQGNDLHYRLIFVSTGGHILHNKDVAEPQEDRAVMYLVPSGLPISIQACHQELEIIVLHFKASTSLCGGLCPERRDPSQQTQCSPPNDKTSHYRPRRLQVPQASKLGISTGVALWLQGVKHLMLNPHCDYRYYDHRIEELFYLIRYEYEPSDTDTFLAQYHCRISGFRECIMSNYRADMEVSDLYIVGETQGLSEAAFKRSFLEEFGSSPREWLIERRAKLIYQDLITTDKNFKELSSKYGFCNVSYFGAFCRQTLGDTPLRIRKRVQS